MVRISFPTAVCPPEGWWIATYGLEFQLCVGISAIIGPAQDVHFCTTNGFCRFIGGGDGRGWGGCMCRKEGRYACKCMSVRVRYSDRMSAGRAVHLGVQSIFRKRRVSRPLSRVRTVLVIKNRHSRQQKTILFVQLQAQFTNNPQSAPVWYGICRGGRLDTGGFRARRFHSPSSRTLWVADIPRVHDRDRLADLLAPDD